MNNLSTLAYQQSNNVAGTGLSHTSPPHFSGFAIRKRCACLMITGSSDKIWTSFVFLHSKLCSTQKSARRISTGQMIIYLFVAVAEMRLSKWPTFKVNALRSRRRCNWFLSVICHAVTCEHVLDDNSIQSQFVYCNFDVNVQLLCITYLTRLFCLFCAPNRRLTGLCMA